MSEHQIIDALGDGWLGKAVAGVIAFAVAWFTRRPVAHAAIMAAVDGRIETLMNHQAAALARADAEIENLKRDLIDEKARCDDKLDTLQAKIEALEAGPKGPPGARGPRGRKGAAG
jgi:3-hydroxyacyl-CoA dehydrogenase